MTVAENFAYVCDVASQNNYDKLKGGGIFIETYDPESAESQANEFHLSHLLAADNYKQVFDPEMCPDPATSGPHWKFPGAEGSDLEVEATVFAWSVDYSLIEVFDLIIDGSSVTSLGGDGNMTGNKTPLGLLPLDNYGGPTETHAIASYSPAIDQGDPNADTDPDVPDWDQRGDSFGRIEDFKAGDADIDIGAFELQVGECVNDADFNEDGTVDGDDFLLWQAGFGTSSGATHANGDADCDEDVDGNDFLIWQTQFDGGGGAGSISMGTPMKVTDVIVSGSTSMHDPFSFREEGHTGDGVQLETVPVGGADTISIVFSELGEVVAGDLQVIGLYTGNVPSLVEFSYDFSTMTGTWQFDGWTFGDQYALVVSDGVTDTDGALDGEWTNPANVATTTTTSEFAPTGDSGNGTAGGDFSFVMTLLPGDADLNNIVNGSDYLIWQINYPTAVDAVFSEADFDGDGDVDGVDFGIWQDNYGINLEDLWLLADLDGDYDVDNDDWDVVDGNNGIITSGATWADGDLDGDGDVDQDDEDLATAQLGLNLNVVS